jgi:hypothetical protein
LTGNSGHSVAAIAKAKFKLMNDRLFASIDAVTGVM